MSIPTYALAAFSKRDPISNEAAIKYFLFGALSSAILVVAIGLVYGITGSTNIGVALMAFVTLPQNLAPIGLLAIALFVAGFGFKMGLVPFHMWLPDAYEGAPTTIGALLAAGTKKAGFAACHSCHCVGNVCPQLGLDDDPCYHCYLYDDTRKSGSASTKKRSKNSCIFQYRTSRLHNDRIGPCTVY